ncbi:hypothetical protein DFA_05023 [Cavenderia fasciculata]|uniref:Uncharacterized protein n=1 Tax=Cavenderia fasciculata TaxID=261658 RepID=F4PN00_CACFS|nr:uncharacterized protein DFA_05023 [Cavenderia fasciculata]EGG22893.1 hypothetical protein DFA_05023 [Cavenderia fasciculata]|eukprot:XP_004360744.1 hypothetical protein DFA_05023 [Cavenderia fasciculata]
MGLFSTALSITADAAFITTSLAAVRHFTGFSVHRVANLIKNDSVKKAAVVYLNSGEFIFDKSLDIINNKVQSNNNNNNNSLPPNQQDNNNNNNNQNNNTTTNPYSKKIDIKID